MIAFTTTRWNALLKATTTKTTSAPPTLGECLSYRCAATAPVAMMMMVMRRQPWRWGQWTSFSTRRATRELRDALAALNLCNNLVENCTGLAVLQNMLQNGSGSSSDTDNGSCFPMSEEDAQRWRAYGDAITAIMQANDGFDEYPEEEEVVRRKEGLSIWRVRVAPLTARLSKLPLPPTTSPTPTHTQPHHATSHEISHGPRHTFPCILYTL